MNNTAISPSLKKTASRLGLAVAVTILVHQVVAGTAGAIIGLYFPSFLQTSYGFWLLSYLPLYVIAVPIYFIIARTAKTTDPDREKIKMPLNTFIKWWFISMAAMWIFNIVSVAINALIAAIKGSPIVNPISDLALSSGMLYNILFGVIIAPIGEELMFRWMFYKKLAGFGDKPYILISALCFALMHGNLSQLLYAFVLGMIFAYIMARTRNIIYPIIMHIVVNAYGLVIAPLALGNEIILAALGFALIAVVVFGIILFIRTKKRGFVFDAATQEVSETPVKDSLLNFGIIAVSALGIALCIFVIIMPSV